MRGSFYPIKVHIFRPNNLLVNLLKVIIRARPKRSLIHTTAAFFKQILRLWSWGKHQFQNRKSSADISVGSKYLRHQTLNNTIGLQIITIEFVV